jgi:acyl-CoA synthetase (NDP forming)
VTRPVGTLLAPRSVAIVGASQREDAVGFRIIRNLTRLGFPGAIFPVNPRHAEVSGLPCYPSLSALPVRVDTAFIAVPNTQGPALVEEAGRAGIRGVVVNASGYADGGPDGRALQARLEAAAATHGIALCGPNNMGFINVHGSVALWTSARMPELKRGPVAIISQSGSIAIALSQDERGIGLAYIITAGNEAVLTASDYLAEVVKDEHVRVVLLFLESIRDPARFAEAVADARARGKPVIAVKAGRSERGRVAVAAHSGALAGEDEVYDAFFERHGIVRVHDLDEMIEAATLFAVYPEPPASRSVAALTLSGGEAALAADLGADAGLEFPALGPDTVHRLKAAFPPFATPCNPVDAWGLGWDAERFRQILSGLAEDAGPAAILVGVDVTAAGGGDTVMATEMATICGETAKLTEKRFIFFNNATGNGPNPDLQMILRSAGIPYLSGMGTALAVLGYWTKHGERRKRAAEPSLDQERAERWRAAVRDLDALGEEERFRLLRDAGLPMVASVIVHSAEAAMAAAERVGYPVALKGTAIGALHKTDRGLVRLDLATPAAVRAAFADLAPRSGHDAAGRPELVVQPMIGPGVELIVAIRNDPAFGSLTIVGPGGVYVELLREASVRIGPVSVADAAAMLRQTRAGTLLDGFRDAGPFDAGAAAEAIAALSAFGAATHGLLAAAEINPLLVLPQGRGAVGVDLLLESVALATASPEST